MDAAEVIRRAIPGATDMECEHILWGRTPFPVGAVTARRLYEAADRYRRATAAGRRLCEHCDNMARQGEWECAECAAALGRVRATTD